MEGCQVCKVPVVSEVLQCQAMQQAGQMHDCVCKPAGPAPAWVMGVDVRRQSASIHHQGLSCRIVSMAYMVWWLSLRARVTSCIIKGLRKHDKHGIGTLLAV